MERKTSPAVVFCYHRPSGSPNSEPSAAMSEALRQLSVAQEMEPLFRTAHEVGREVVIEVFQSRDGQPLLIHTALRPKTFV